MPLDVWQCYIKTMNFPVREWNMSFLFNFKTYPNMGLVDLDPVFLVAGSFQHQIVDHIQKKTGKHFPKIGNNIFESININGDWFVIVNRHLLMNAVMDHRVSDLNDVFKTDVWLFANKILTSLGVRPTMEPELQLEIVEQMAKAITPQISKRIDI